MDIMVIGRVDHPDLQPAGYFGNFFPLGLEFIGSSDGEGAPGFHEIILGVYIPE
jgi:hypothetical protein